MMKIQDINSKITQQINKECETSIEATIINSKLRDNQLSIIGSSLEAEKAANWFSENMNKEIIEHDDYPEDNERVYFLNLN